MVRRKIIFTLIFAAVYSFASLSHSAPKIPIPSIDLKKPSKTGFKLKKKTSKRRNKRKKPPMISALPKDLLRLIKKKNYRKLVSRLVRTSRTLWRRWPGSSFKTADFFAPPPGSASCFAINRITKKRENFWPGGPRLSREAGA
jgi:hypothetical protein